MKRFLTVAGFVLTFVFGLHASGLAQSRNLSPRAGSKQETVNHPPKINSLGFWAETLTIPCPSWDAPDAVSCTTWEGRTLPIMTSAEDPDGDALRYQYSVTGGKIIGEGASVKWDYYKLAPGSYTVGVVVSDQRGGTDSLSMTLKIIRCPVCDPPCHGLTITCASEAEEGEPITFSIAIVRGDPQAKPTYNWSVSAGTITKGQGTPEIEVDTTGLGGQRVIATVEVGGLRPVCDRIRSCDVDINKKSEKEGQ